MSWFTNILLSFGLRDKVKQLVNVVIAVAIKEGKDEIDKIKALSPEGKAEAKNGVDILAAKLSSLINERLDKL